MSYKDRKFQEQTTAEVSYTNVDPGVTLHYIMLQYDPHIFSLLP